MRPQEELISRAAAILAVTPGAVAIDVGNIKICLMADGRDIHIYIDGRLLSARIGGSYFAGGVFPHKTLLSTVEALRRRMVLEDLAAIT